MPDPPDLIHDLASLAGANVGRDMHAFMAELYPICRSISGAGLRETLNAIGERIPLEISEVPTGTEVFDWTIPREWNVREAWVRGPDGEKVVDFCDSNLHVVSYSTPVHRKLSLEDLQEHLFSLPEHPEWIPYRTSYYREFWGFCLAHRQREALAAGTYEVFIDSTLEDGSLSYAECVLPGRSDEEILVSCHTCHPSTCNDNLSGVALVTFLASLLRELPLRYTYRFLFNPGGIGSIAWLSRNEERLERIRHGLVAVCVGDPGSLTYKRSRRENADVDRAALHVLERSGADHQVIDFSPYGYDERNFSSPAFDLPVGSLSRSTHTRYAEYHTSADDLDFVRPEFLADSLEKYLSIIEVLEQNRRYLSLSPKGEPQLGKRGLYAPMGGLQDRFASEVAMLWILNYADGHHDLLDVARKSRLEMADLHSAAVALCEHGLLEELG
ncbi:MAG: DUF4910 domain-containing protein [Deltaproteobacteria bacterium]|nr:DUF4910 domain-containing protein [Deltaproteobacteria bacterium]MBW2363079.1 DUF4910 domain-containing protein [Deltaproteobacteria bacterium]